MDVNVLVQHLQLVNVERIADFGIVELCGHTGQSFSNGSLAFPFQFPAQIRDLIDPDFKTAVFCPFLYIPLDRICLCSFKCLRHIVQKIQSCIFSVQVDFLIINVQFRINDSIKFLFIAVAPQDVVARLDDFLQLTLFGFLK